MKTLKEYIIEGILDIEDNIENLTAESLIKDFIRDNYNTTAEIQIKKNGDKYIVSTKGSVEVENKNITSLTNGVFEWGEVNSFYCYDCISLKDLKGAPEKVKRNFSCADCTSLESLTGAPKEVGGQFNCDGCTSLKDLTGAPEKVGGWFNCDNCTSLKDLTGAPKEVKAYFSCSECKSLKDLTGAPEKVGGGFDCSKCTSLKDLTGAPKEVGGSFECKKCGKRFTREDVIAVCDVKGEIKV